MVKFILNPFNFLLFGFLLVPMTFFSFNNINVTNLWLVFFVPICLYIVFYFIGKKLAERIIVSFQQSKDFLLKSIYWKTFALLVFIASILEYFLFGLPIINLNSYSTYGLPLLHHMAVSSWLLLFIKFNSNLFNKLKMLFVVLNPILILNRDLLMLTIFSLLLISILRGKLKAYHLIAIFFIIILVFGLIGQIRSEHALKIIILPFSFDTENVNPLIFWFLLYALSPTFNFLYSLSFGYIELYDPLINAYPEPLIWILNAGYQGFILFYLLIIVILIFFSLIAKDPKYIPMYIFFLYQSLMGVIFAPKFFTTNSLFVIIIFFIFFILSQHKYARKSRE